MLHLVIAVVIGLVVGIGLGYGFRGKENRAINAAGAVVKGVEKKL